MIGVYGSIAVITLVASYLLMHNIGITGVGVAWVIGNSATTLGIGLKKKI